MEKTVAFYTLGCKVNQYETEGISQQFKLRGYTIKDFDEVCNVYVINTCSVTQFADRKSRTAVRKARKLNPDATVVVCGCYSQTHKEQAIDLKEADIVLGNLKKDSIVDLVEKKDEEKTVVVKDIMQQKEFEETSVLSHGDKTRAFMKIQDGCDNYCAYCIIPYARGHIRSRNIENIKKEAELFVKNGYKEIVLTGIHITSYGKESGDNTLVDVLKILHEIKGLDRIRLGSLEYNEQLMKVAENAASLPKLCNHFHVSLQSGCDKTLRRMGRKYTAEEFLKGINSLRKAFPGAAITTDIMVGFPGETEEEFTESMAFAREARFSKMHIFPYSIREGTKAAKMKNQLTFAVKKERAAALEKIDNINITEFAKKQIGEKALVLFEKKDGDYYMGHTTNYLLVYVKSQENIEKEIKKVLISDYKDGKLYGKIY